MPYTGTIQSSSGIEYPIEFEKEPTQEDYDLAFKEVQRIESVPQTQAEVFGQSMGRGIGGIIPTAVKGAGDVLDLIPGTDTGISGLGASMQKGVREAFPVNPAAEGTVLAKSGEALGQGIGFLGSALISGGAAVPLSIAGLSGAAGGADLASELGLTGLRRVGMTLGFGAAEAGVEMVGGPGAPAFLRNIAKGTLGAAATEVWKEAIEEPITGQLQDIIRDIAVLGTDKESVNLFRPGVRAEELLYGAIGASPIGLSVIGRKQLQQTIAEAAPKTRELVTSVLAGDAATTPTTAADIELLGTPEEIEEEEEEPSTIVGAPVEPPTAAPAVGTAGAAVVEPGASPLGETGFSAPPVDDEGIPVEPTTATEDFPVDSPEGFPEDTTEDIEAEPDDEGLLDDLEREDSLLPTAAVPPENPLTQQQVEDHLQQRYGMAPGTVTVVDRPGIRREGWIMKSGRIFINSAWNGSTEMIDKTLAHEGVHRVEALPETQADIDAVLGTLSEAETQDLEARLISAGYTPNDFPSEKAAHTVTDMAFRLQGRPAFQRMVQKVKTYFKESFGMTLNQRDAEVISARVVANGLKAIKEGRPATGAVQSARPIRDEMQDLMRRADERRAFVQANREDVLERFDVAARELLDRPSRLGYEPAEKWMVDYLGQVREKLATGERVPERGLGMRAPGAPIYREGYQEHRDAYDTAAERVRDVVIKAVGKTRDISFARPLPPPKPIAKGAPPATPSPEADHMRVGTAKLGTEARPVPTPNTSNITGAIVPEENLAEQMPLFDAYPQTPEEIRAEKDPQKKRKMLIEHFKKNLIALVKAFPKEFRDRATHWYDGANIIATNFARQYKLTLEQAAGVIAVLSPQKDWFSNVAQAEQVLDIWFNEQDTRLSRKLIGANLERIINAAEAPQAKLKKVRAQGLSKEATAAEIGRLNQEAKDKRREIVEKILGKTVRELSSNPTLQGWAIRVLAETMHGQSYRVISPEGDPMHVATNDDGAIARMAWGGVGEIEKVVRIIQDGSLQNISENLSNQHKVRSFYNNIVAPRSPFGDGTMDTHAVAAAWILPLGSSAPEVKQNFDSIGSTAKAGVNGLYHVYLDAYTEAAKELELLPRQVQSIAWEAVRSLFSNKSKNAMAESRKAWNDLSHAAARKHLLREGIPPPEWARTDAGGGPGALAAGIPKNGSRNVAGRSLRFRGGPPTAVRSGVKSARPTQVFGKDLGPERDPASFAPVIKAIQDNFFNSGIPVTPGNTADAHDLVTDMLDPVKGQKMARDVADSLDPVDKNLGVGVLHTELMHYANKVMRETGDPSLFNYLNDSLNDIVIDSDGKTFRDYAQTVAGRSNYPLSGFMTGVKVVIDDRDAAVATAIPEEVLPVIDKVVKTTKVTAAGAEGIGTKPRPRPGGKTATTEEIIEDAIAAAPKKKIKRTILKEILAEPIEPAPVAPPAPTPAAPAAPAAPRPTPTVAKPEYVQKKPFGADIIKYADKRAAELREEMRKMLAESLGRTSLGVDPAIIPKVVEYGALKLLKGGVKFGQWLGEMRDELGAFIDELDMADIWKQANDKIEKFETKVEAPPAPPKPEVSAEDKTAQRYIDKVDESQVEILTPDAIENPVLKYLRAHEDPPFTKSKDDFVKSVTEGLKDLGVSEAMAINAANRVWLRKEARRDAIVRRKEKAAREASTKAAQSFINTYDRTQTEVVLPAAEVDPATKILRSAQKMTSDISKGDFIKVVSDNLTDVGVEKGVAINAANRAWSARETRMKNEEIRAKERAAEREEKRTSASAEKILNEFAKAQSDTPSLTPKQVDPVRKLIKQAMAPTSKFSRDQLVKELENLGVSPSIATPLAEAVWTQRKANEEIRTAEAARDLASGERGSLKPLQRALVEATAAQQRDPKWRRETMISYFSQLGLSADRAAAAARLYDEEFRERLAEAIEAEIDKQAKSSAPWKEKVSKVHGGLKAKMNADLEKVKKAIRSGLLDPSKTWKNEVAKANGWTGFTNAQYQRMAQIDDELSRPDIMDYEVAKLLAEMEEIVSKAKIPEKTASLIVSSYVASALSGLSTLFVQSSPHIALVRDYLGDLLTEPVIATKAFIAAIGNIGTETKFALKNDVYTHQVGDHMKGYEKPLKRYFEQGLKDLQSSNPLIKAHGLWKCFTGAQLYSTRLLNSIDQGFISTAEVYKATIFTDRVLKRMGVSRNEAGRLIEAAMTAKANSIENAVDNGMNENEAAVRSNELFLKELFEVVRKQGPEGEKMAKDVRVGAEKEAMGMVGRLSADVTPTRLDEGGGGEGFLSTPINAIIQGLNEHLLNKGGFEALKGRSLFGFVTIPFRTARWYAGYTPYGYVRALVHYHAGKTGRISPYQQSYGSNAQARQRLRDATLGTLLGAAAYAFAAATGDDDPEKEEFKFFITGKGPTDKTLRDVWNKRFKPYALVVKVGKSYVPLNLGRAFESIAWPLAFAGAVDDTNTKEKGALARSPLRDFPGAAETFGAYFGSLSQRSSFQGINKLAEIGKGVNTARAGTDVANLLAFSASAAIPWKGAFNSITRLISDPVDRNSMMGAIFSNTPIVGPLIGRPAINTFADPIGDQTLAGRLYSAGVPVTVRFPASTPNSKAYDVVMQKGRGPAPLRRNDLEKIYGKVNDAQFYEMSAIRGRALKKAMADNAAKLIAMDQEDYGNWVENISRTENPKAAKAVGLVKPTKKPAAK